MPVFIKIIQKQYCNTKFQKFCNVHGYEFNVHGNDFDVLTKYFDVSEKI